MTYVLLLLAGSTNAAKIPMNLYRPVTSKVWCLSCLQAASAKDEQYCTQQYKLFGWHAAAVLS